MKPCAYTLYRSILLNLARSPLRILCVAATNAATVTAMPINYSDKKVGRVSQILKSKSYIEKIDNVPIGTNGSSLALRAARCQPDSRPGFWLMVLVFDILVLYFLVGYQIP